ncbi:aminodeoxychorismate lyase [Colwellia sp. MEBiC06753]
MYLYITMSILHSEIYLADDKFLPLTERSVAYGDGLFTTAKICQGQVVNLSSHMARLQSGASFLGIDVDFTGLAEHLAHIASEYKLAVIKVVVTAGEGGRGYSRINSFAQKILISVHPYPEHYLAWQDKGIKLGLATTQLGVNPQLAGIKHLNRLEQVMVRRELDQKAEDDLLVCNYLNEVVETTAGNVFWLSKGDNSWYTPDLAKSGVDGLVRQQILSRMVGQCNAKQVVVTPEALKSVTSMFICNSVMGIVPVRQYLDFALDIAPVHALKQEFSL